jgi:hypothetical protein
MTTDVTSSFCFGWRTAVSWGRRHQLLSHPTHDCLHDGQTWCHSHVVPAQHDSYDHDSAGHTARVVTIDGIRKTVYGRHLTLGTLSVYEFAPAYLGSKSYSYCAISAYDDATCTLGIFDDHFHGAPSQKKWAHAPPAPPRSKNSNARRI